MSKLRRFHGEPVSRLIVSVPLETVSFRLGGQFYRQVPNSGGVLKLLASDRRVPKRPQTFEQAERIAWRIILRRWRLQRLSTQRLSRWRPDGSDRKSRMQ